MAETAHKSYYEDYWKFRKEKGRIHTLDGMWIPQRVQTAVEWVAADIASGTASASVLDIGCGEGTTGKLIGKSAGNKVSLYGWDISSTALDLARQFYNQVFCLNAENDPVPDFFSSGKMDYVIILDVLEHLYRPENLLLKCKKVLKPGGKLVASFPNIAWYKYRLELLAGRFPSDQLYGTGDHIQQFTLPAFSSMLKGTGYEIRKLGGKFEYPGWLRPGRIFHPLLRRFPALFGYQIVVYAESR